MKNKLLALMAICLLLTSLEARGGRGGGGGGRGGGNRGGGRSYSGGHVMNRTPSMSRAAPRAAGNRADFNRTAGNRNIRNVNQRPSAQNRQDLRNQVNRYTQNRPAGNINRQDLSARNQNFSNNRRNQIAQNRQFSNLASDRVRRNYPNSNRWFDRDFFDRHDINVGYRGDLWRPAAWATLATWGAWNWSTPYYYDNGGYSYPVTTTEYASYSYPTTTSAPAYSAPAPESDWLPLGVFAVASNAAGAATSSRFIQLAVNRNGEIDGVYYNAATDTTQDLAGTVDAKTQMASWSLSDKPNSPIASTGLYNLTEDETPISVHFSDGTEQTWTLVRIQQ